MSYLAIDLGAGSGRAIAADITANNVSMDEVYRFVCPPVRLGTTLYWDFLALFAHIKEGIKAAVSKGHSLQGIAIDTWGVDFGLIDKHGTLLCNPVCYRDSRTAGMLAHINGILPAELLYSRTGVQPMEINTLCQLLAMKQGGSPTLYAASKLLMMPDLINFFLTGRIACEYTIASTTQMLGAVSREWDSATFAATGLPQHLMPSIIPPGSPVGMLRKDIALEAGIRKARVYSAASHDTASAIAAIPMEENAAFLSSGTWSLLGVCLDKPILTRKAIKHGFTNEGGANGKYLFMKNLTGLWLLQRLIAEWEQDGDTPCDYGFLLHEASMAAPKQSIVDTEVASLVNPPSMRTALQRLCRMRSQHVPESKGELLRCVLESLARKYKETIALLQDCTGKNLRRIYIVGGGSKNDLFNQIIADELGMEVIVGIPEATALGSVMQQAIAAGKVSNWQQAHDIIWNSFDFKTYYSKS